MVYPEVDITRGLLNQDMEAHMVDTLGDPVEDSQEGMLDPTLDIPVVMVSTQEDMVDITRGLLNQDMEAHMVDTLGDPVEDSQEVNIGYSSGHGVHSGGYSGYSGEYGGHH